MSEEELKITPGEESAENVAHELAAEIEEAVGQEAEKDESALNSEPDPEFKSEPELESKPESDLEPEPELKPESELEPESESEQQARMENEAAAGHGVDSGAPPAISDGLLERAVNVGIPVVDARELSPESLGRVIEMRERAYEQVSRDASLTAEREEEKKVDPLTDIPKLDPDTYEPEIIEVVERLTNTVKEQRERIENFDAKFEEASRVHQDTNRRDAVQWFDKQVSDLGEDFVDALGAGGYDSLDQGSTQFAKREALANQVSMLLAGYKATEQQVPPREEVFDMAARLVLEEEFQQIHERKLAKNLETRASQHIQRAGGQEIKGTQTPEEEIAAALDKKFGIGI